MVKRGGRRVVTLVCTHKNADLKQLNWNNCRQAKIQGGYTSMAPGLHFLCFKISIVDVIIDICRQYAFFFILSLFICKS